jgi:hypothetical protein
VGEVRRHELQVCNGDLLTGTIKFSDVTSYRDGVRKRNVFAHHIFSVVRLMESCFSFYRSSVVHQPSFVRGKENRPHTKPIPNASAEYTRPTPMHAPGSMRRNERNHRENRDTKENITVPPLTLILKP